MSQRSVLLALTGLRIDGGIASVSRCIVRALDGCVEAGTLDRTDQVLLFDDPAESAPAPRRGEQRLALGSKLRFAWQVWHLALRGRPDWVFLDHVGLARVMRLPLPGLRGRPYVLFAHGMELEAARGGPRLAALRGASRILANSDFTADLVRRIAPEVSERLRVTPLCIDPERVTRWEATGNGDAPKREPAALVVGRMVAEERGKGHDELIAAWTRVRERSPEARLWIVGGGDDRARLEAAAHDAGLGDGVRFFGRVDDDELRRLYRSAAVFAMPSRQEGFGLVYAEALWHGLPCIASRDDAARGIVREGETGWLVPYGDVDALVGALCEALEDPARTERMGEAGRQDARSRFGYPRFRRDLLAALDLA